MNIDKSTTLQEKIEQESRSNVNTMKLSVTQNVIRNKFKTAYMHRLEDEHNVNQAMKPLTVDPTITTSSIKNEMETNENDFPIQNQSETITTTNWNAAKINSKQPFKLKLVETNNIPNELCNRLREILTSTNVDSTNHSEEISQIIKKLRNLEILT